MRIHLLVGLGFLAAGLLSQCTTAPETRTMPAATAPTAALLLSAKTDTIVTTRFVESLDPDPNKPYREMPIEPMGAEPTNYSASVVCKRDSLGAMILEMKLNPSRHSIEKVSLAFGMARPKQKAQQIGGGVGHYDAEKQRYYFSVYYQVVTQLANNQILYSDLYPVHGWVSTRTNTLGLQL